MGLEEGVVDYLELEAMVGMVGEGEEMEVLVVVAEVVKVLGVMGAARADWVGVMAEAVGGKEEEGEVHKLGRLHPTSLSLPLCH